MAISNPNAQAAMDEVRKTKETAARLANGEYPEDADHIRVLAGMIQKLAEQIERLVEGGPSAEAPTPSDVESRVDREAEAAAEEDQTPQDAPADPVNDRN
jgi:cytochrome c556